VGREEGASNPIGKKLEVRGRGGLVMWECERWVAEVWNLPGRDGGGGVV